MNVFTCVTVLSRIHWLNMKSFTATEGSLWAPCATCPGRQGNRGDPPLSSPPLCDWPGCSGFWATVLRAACPDHHKRSASGPGGETGHEKHTRILLMNHFQSLFSSIILSVCFFFFFFWLFCNSNPKLKGFCRCPTFYLKFKKSSNRSYNKDARKAFYLIRCDLFMCRDVKNKVNQRQNRAGRPLY